MRLVTWNINSIRPRLHHVEAFCNKHAPDVICFQETKAHDDVFPDKAIQDMGFPYIYKSGMKSYNGVAIISRISLEAHSTRDWVGRADCRYNAITLPGNIRLHNFYVPAGGDIPDPDQNDKFAHKLAFLDEMKGWFSAEFRKDDPMILVGDLNIAPLESDVWSHKQLLKVVSHTPIETEKLIDLQTSFGWLDAMRHFIPEDEKLYTWWSYRAKDWLSSNKGRRLDHVWVTPPLKDRLRGISVDLEARGWEKPSDHAPVILDLAD